MTDRLTRRGGQRAKPLHEALIQETEQHNNFHDAITESDDDDDDITHDLPQQSMSTLGILRCGKKSLCSCASRSVTRRGSSVSSWCPNPITYGWYSVNYLYWSLTQSTLSPSSEVLVEEQDALTTTKQAEADDETPETRSSPHSSPVSGAPKTIQIIIHQATDRLLPLTNLHDDDFKLIVSHETASSNALTIQDTSLDEEEDESCTSLASSEKSAPSRLPDYAKCVATLPDTSPLEYLYPTDQQQRHDEDDDSTVADLDFFPPIDHPSDIKVQFFLRMPIASKLKSGRHRSDVPQNILSKSSRHPTAPTITHVPRVNRKSSRRRSSSSDNKSVDSTDYVVPLGDPTMSRENSVENLEKMGNDWVGFRSPIQKRRNSVESSPGPSLDESIDLSTHPTPEPVESVLVPLKDDDFGVVTPLRSNTSEDEGLGYGYRQAYSDSDLVDQDPQKNESRQKHRMQRRSSFVAGSKIERFDCSDHPTSQNKKNSPNNHHHQLRRGRKQRGGAANDAASYTKWKIYLMVNEMK